MNQEEVWDKIAYSWNNRRQKPVSFAVKFIKSIKGENLKILDLGCGSGRNFIKINGMLYGTDFSEKMLEFAREKSIKNKISVRLTRSPADKLPFQENFFDALVCVSVLNCISGKENRQAVMREIHRVLKPKAMALVSVWAKMGRFKNKPKEGNIGWTAGEDGYDRYNYFYDKDELEKELRETGFKIVKCWEEKSLNDPGNIIVEVEK